MSDQEKPVTVGELIAFLSKIPAEREVLYCLHSDYEGLYLGDIDVAGAVPKGSYYMREHPTMSAENKAAKKLYVIFPGN
jgi:hypothetical protein